MSTEIKIEGLAALNKVLQELPAKIERNILRGGLRAGQKIIADAAKANISNHSGDLRDSIRVKTRARRGNVTAIVVAGDENAFYAHMVEFGTAAHYISVSEKDKPKRTQRIGKGRSVSMKTINKMVARGSLVVAGRFVGPTIHHPGAAPKPFMRPAIDNNADRAVEAFKEYVAQRIPKEIKKAGK